MTKATFHVQTKEMMQTKSFPVKHLFRRNHLKKYIEKFTKTPLKLMTRQGV